MKTYLFYDIETTGLSKPFDQVLHFAAIRTDLNLNEIERYDYKIKLNPDVTPSPRALITHYIGVKEASDGLLEFEAIKKIHQQLNAPGTISLGYNTLGFDDEFLRFSFYRNLLTPYTHQYANQCGRMDIYPMAIMYFLYKNQVIAWPKINEKISLKLENINAANEFFVGRSHHAMVDVEVTLALAKKLFQEREMWTYLTDYFNKITDEKRSLNLIENMALMIYGKMGADNNFQAPVLFLGTHRHYKNQQLWLRLDLPELTSTTEDSIPETTWVIRKKIAEPGFILPFNSKHLQHLSAERLALTESNKKWLQQHPEILQKITNYHAEFKYPTYPDTDVEAGLYLNGFWSQEEEQFCRQFHKATPEEKARMTENLRPSKLKTIATRLLGRCYPEKLSGELAENFADYLKKTQDTMLDFRGEKRLTKQMALDDIALIKNEMELNETQLGLLEELQIYLEN